MSALQPRSRFTWERFRIPLLLAPALSVILLLFGGGLLLTLSQSFGYLPIIGKTEFSLAAWQAIFQRGEFWQSLFLTLWIGGVATLTSTILAILCALTLRKQFRGKKAITFLFQLNIPIPHIVGAIGILLLFSQSGLIARLANLAGMINDPAQFPALVNDRYAFGIIAEYVWKETCFIGTIVLATLQSVGEDYENAAASLGANRWQRFRYVTLPLIMPGVLTASILVFAFAFGAFEIPFLLGRRFPSALSVLAWRSYTDTDLALRPEAMAMSLFIALVSTGLILLYMTISRKLVRE